MLQKRTIAITCLTSFLVAVGAVGVALSSSDTPRVNLATAEYRSVVLDSSNLLVSGSPISGKNTFSTKYGTFEVNAVGLTYDAGTSVFSIGAGTTSYILVDTPSKPIGGAGGTGYVKADCVGGSNIAFRGYDTLVSKPYTSQKLAVDISSGTGSFGSFKYPYISFGTNNTTNETPASFKSLTFYWGCQ